MKTKHLVIGAIGAGVIGLTAAVAFPIAIAAQTDSSQITQFVQSLAGKLSLSEDKVQTALDEIKTETQAQRLSDLKSELAEAVTAGKITSRQAEILTAAEEIRQDSTPRQRALGDATDRTERDTETVAALKEKGVTTTVEELQAAQKAAQDAGLKMDLGHRGGMGMPGMR